MNNQINKTRNKRKDLGGKDEYNKRMINQRVYVLVSGGFYGTIVGVDGDMFDVLNDKGETKKVSCFDVRSIE